MEFENDIVACLRVLQAGGTILYPTDTIWGLGCDATNESAVARLFDIKKRPSSKSMIVLLGETRDIIRYVSQPDPAVYDYLASATRPTTVIYPGAVGLAGNLLAEDGTVGIRIVQDLFCRHLIKRFRKPVVSTSANISGKQAPEHFGEIDEEILQSVDYVVQYRREDRNKASASAVVRFDKRGQLTIIRP